MTPFPTRKLARMRDFLGNQLEVGDQVVFQQSNYREFSMGVVSRFTPQYVVVTYFQKSYSASSGPIKGVEFRQKPEQLIKVPCDTPQAVTEA